MKKTMMYLPDDMHRYLATEAASRGVSMAEIAREAIAHYRAQAASAATADVSAIVGIVAEQGALTNDAVRVDEVLASYYEPGAAWDEEHGCADPA
jgi:hypothetical protein